jgi:hypothetical protein
VAGQWNSNRDGSWYSSPLLEASGSIHSPLNAIEVYSIRARGGVVTAPQLHALLLDTRDSFKGMRIDLALSQDVRAALAQCTEQGLVNWELIQNPFSQTARVLTVASSDAAGRGK